MYLNIVQNYEIDSLVIQEICICSILKYIFFHSWIVFRLYSIFIYLIKQVHILPILKELYVIIFIFTIIIYLFLSIFIYRVTAIDIWATYSHLCECLNGTDSYNIWNEWLNILLEILDAIGPEKILTIKVTS